MAERVIQEDGLNLDGGEDGLNLEGGKDVLNLEGGNKETVEDLEGGNNTDMHSRNVSTYSSDTSMFADFHIFYPHGRGEAVKTVKTRAELEPFSPRNLKVSLNPTFILQGFIFSGSHFLGLEHCGFRNVRARASSTLMSLLSTSRSWTAVEAAVKPGPGWSTFFESTKDCCLCRTRYSHDRGCLC